MDPTKDFPDLNHYQSDLLSDINSSLLFSHPTMFGIASSQPSPSSSSSFNFMSATSNESSSSPFTALQGAFGSKKTAINKRSPQNRGPRSSELRGVGNRSRGASNSTKLKRLVSGHGKGIGRSARRSLDSIPNLDLAAVNQEESLEALIGEKGSLLEDSPEVEEQWAGKVCALCCHGERSQLGQGELIRLEIPLDHEIMRQAHRNQSAPEDLGHADKIQKPPTPLKKPRLSVKSRRSSSVTGEASLSEVQEELNNVGYTEDPDLSSVFESTGHFFVHHWCGMWCVGGASAPAAFPSASQLALVIGQCLSRRCNYCSGLGATLLCAYPSCSQNFHWPCAVASGAFLNIKTWAVHCPEHVHQGSVEAKIDGVCTSCGVPGEVTNLMGCTTCGNHWHGSCLGLSLSASVRVAWQCTDCKICVGCRAVGEDNKLLVCDACDKSYHPYCVRPHLSNIPKMGWKCKNCRVCGDCGSRTPGSGPSSRWHACFSVCDSCYQQRNKGAACPLCGKAYRHSQREMSHCHICRKYVHASCDPEADRSLCARKKELNPDYEYQCPVCKAGGGSMTPKTPLMGMKKELIGDEDELTRGSDVHTPSEESSMSMDVDLDKLWKDVEDGGKGYHGDKGKPGLASGGGKGGAGRKRMPPGRPKGVGKTGSIWNLSCGQTASQKRSKPADFVKKRGPKPKMRGVFGAPGVTLQRPAGEPAGREEEPGTENKLVLCSSQDEFVLGQDVCVLCGALGLDAEGRLISCAQCGQCFHPYCANVKLSKVLLTKGWRCLECTVCEGCGQRNDEARLLLCDDCDISYHIYCMDPPLENVPPGNWKCKWCAVCTVCGSQERGRNSTWQDSYSKCGPCGSLTQCPVCNNAYADAELLIQCTACDRWLHGNCDSIRNENDAEICSAQDYQCLMCRPADMPPPHLLAPPPVLPVPPSLKLSNTTPPPPPSPSVTTPTSMTQTQASTSTVSKTSTTLTPSTLAPPASPAQYVVDGIALSETGMRHLQSLRLTDTPRRRMRKPKGQPANDSEAIWATIESVVSGGVARPGDFEHEKDGEGEEMDMPKDGTILQPREDGRMPEVPEGYSVVQGDGGVLILRKKRQRNLQKLGIGGFQLRRPWARTKEDENISNNEAESGPGAVGAKEGVTGGGAKECGTGGESAGGGDKPKRKMQRRKNKTNRLAESYPSYLQEAFFGKELLDVKKDESSDKESDKEEEKVVSEKSVSVIHLSKDELAALEALKMRNDPEYRRQQLLARAQQQQQHQQQLQQSSAFPRPPPPPQACAFISSRTSSLESSLAPPTPRLSQDSLKLEEEGAGDADDEGDETLKDLLPSDLLDTDDLVDSIMKEAEVEDRGHLDKNSSDSRGDRKDEFRDLLAGLDPGLPTMDSKDVEDLFKGVLTDESQESQDSSLLSITATPPPSQLSIYPAPPSVNPVQPSNFGPSPLETAGTQVMVPAPSHSAAASIPNPLSQRILPTQVSSPSPYPSAADQNSPGFSPGFSEPPSPWPAGAGAGLGDSDAEPGPVASANQRNALKWEVDEALGTNATISAVLYANTNHPELKRDFPDWNNRWKQIAKIWRGLPPEKKAPFLQKARENRAAMRLVKQNQAGSTTVVAGDTSTTLGATPPGPSPSPPLSPALPLPVKEETPEDTKEEEPEPEEEKIRKNPTPPTPLRTLRPNTRSSSSLSTATVHWGGGGGLGGACKEEGSPLPPESVGGKGHPDLHIRVLTPSEIMRTLPPSLGKTPEAVSLAEACNKPLHLSAIKGQSQSRLMDTEVKAPPTPRRTNTESDQERQWKQMQAMRQQQQAAAASDVNRALGDATVQQQPHTADSYTQPRTPFTPPIQVSRVRAPGPDFMRPPMAEQYGMIPRAGEDKTLMKPEVGGTLGGEGMQGPAPAPAPHHQQQLLNLLRPPGPEGHVAFRQPLPPPQGQNMRLPMRMPSNGVPGQPMEFRHPAQVASNNVDPRFSGMPDPRMRMMQQRLPQPMQSNTGLGVMMNPSGYAPQTANQRILHTNATAAPVGIAPMLPDGGIVKTTSELEAGPALLHPDSVKDELATLVGVESNNGAGTGSKGVAAGTGLTATDVEAAELSDMGIDDDDLLGLGNDFNILEYADPELQDADSCAGRGGSASADATDFNILEFAEGDGDADLDTGDEPTRKLEDKTTTSIKDEEGLQEFQAKLLEFSQEQQRREAAEASQGAPQNSVGANLSPATEVSHLPPDFGFGQPPPPYRGPPPPYPGPRPQIYAVSVPRGGSGLGLFRTPGQFFPRRPPLIQEQPLLLEDLLEQEKRELQRQQMARGVVGVPPAATSPDKPFLSDTDFEKLKADVLAGDHVVSLSPPAPPTHHVPQTSMAPIVVKPPQPQLQHQQPLRQPLQHPMIGGVAQHHPVHQHPQLAPPSQQQQQPRMAFHPPPPQQQWTNMNVVDNSNNSIHPAMLSIPPQAQSPAPQPRPSLASNAPSMNFPMQLIPAPTLPPENPTNEAERQQQNNYEQWLYQQQNAIRMQQTYYEAEVNKFRKQRKSLNSRQRQLRKNGQELGDVDASELDRITAEQSGLQKQLDQVRRQARQHTMLMQDYRNKQQKRQQMMGGTLQDVPNLPPAQQQQQQQLQQQPHSPAITTPLSLNQQMSPRSLTGTPQSLMSPGPMRSPMTPMAPSPGLQQAQQQPGMILSPAQPQHSPATMLPSPRMPPQSLEDASSGSVGSPFSPGLGSPPGINNPTHRLPTPQNYPPRLPSPQAAPLQPQQRFMVSQNQTPPPQQQQLRMVGNNPMMMNRYTAPPGALRAQIQQQDPSMALRQRFQGHAMGSGGVNPSQNINLMRPNYPNQQQQFYTQQQQQHSPQPQMQMMANQQRPLTGMQGSPRPVPSPSTCAPPAISPCANAASPMRRPSGGTGPALFPSASPSPALERPQSVENPATPRSVGHGPPTPGSHPSSRAQTPLTPSEPMNHIGTEMEDGNAKMFQQQQQQFHQQQQLQQQQHQQLQQQQQQQTVNRQVPMGYNNGNGAGNPNYAPSPRPMYTNQNMYNYNPSMGNNSGNVTMTNQPQQFGQQVRAMRQPTPAIQNTAYYQQPTQKPFMLQQQQQQQQRPTIRQPMQPQQPQLLSPNAMQVQQQQQFFPQYQQQQQQPQTHTMNHNNQMMQQRMVAPQQQQQQPQQQQWVQQQQQQQYYNANVNQQYVQQSPQQQQQQFSTMNQQMNLQNTNMHQQQMQMQNNANQQQRQQQQQYRVPNPNYPARMTPSQAAPQTPLSELNDSVEEHKDLAVTPSAPAPVSTPAPAVEDIAPSQSMDETPVPQSDGNGGSGGGGGVAGQVMPFPEGFVYIRLGLRGGAPPTKSSERVTQQGISEEAKKEIEPSCMDTPTEVLLMHVKQERIETVTNGEMANEEMKIETDSTSTQVSNAFGEREKMAVSPKDQQVVKEEKPDLEIEEINERKGNIPSTTPLESGQQNALLKQLLQGSSPTPTRLPLQTPPTCTTSQSMGTDKMSNGEVTPSLRTMLTSPIPRTSGTSLLGVSSLELQLAKPIAPPPTSIPSAQIAQIASRVPQATPITAFATVNQSTRPTAVSAATSVSTIVTTPTTPAPRFLQPVVRLERAAVPAPAPPLPVVTSTAPVVSEPIRRLSTTDAPVGEMPTVKTESSEQEAMANDIKAESVLPDPRKESEEARKLKRRQYQQKRRQNSLNAANSNSGTALASTSTAGKESSSHPHPASGTASIIGSSQPKKRLRKGSKLDEDYDAHIETVMTQLRTLPPVSIMEPSLSKNWAVCPVFGLGDVNKLAKSKSYQGDLTGDYAHAQHLQLPDFYNIKPFGDREPVPKKLPIGGIGLPLPDDPTKRGFYHQEFGWPKFGAAVTDSLRAAGASPDRDTDTPDTIVSSSSPECVYPDPPCRFPGLRYIEDEASEEDRSPARKCNSPPIPLYAPVALRPWQKATPPGLPPTPTPPPQPAANVKIQPVEDKENKTQGVVGTTLTLPPSAPVRQVTKPSEGLIREQEALKAHFGLGRGLSPPLPLKDSGNVTVTLTLSAAAAEDVTGVLNKLAALLQVDPPTSYQIVERNPTPPSQKLGLYKGKSVDGKDAPGVDLSSVLQGQAKFCRHCDVVILGPGIVKKLAHLENSTGLNHKKTAEDMEVEEDDGDDSTGEDCSFCSTNCYMQFALSHRVHLTSEEKAAATIVNHSAEKNEKETDAVPSKPTVTIKEEPVVTCIEKPTPIAPTTPAAVTVAPSVKKPVATLAPVPAAEETPLPMPPPPPAAVPPLSVPKTVVAKITEELPVTSPAPLVLPAAAPPALPTPVRRFRGVRYKVFNAANPLTPPQGKKYKKPTENELTEMLYRLGTCIRPAHLPDDTRQCMFCHQTGDGISDGPGRLLNYDVDRWVHLNCALWSEEVYETVNGALMHVDVALRQSLTSICQHCNQNGATIKCWKVRCSTSLHLHCAVKEGCVFYKNKSVFCAAHAPRENKDEQLTTLSVYRRVYINRDDNRQVAAVMHTPDHAHLLRVGSLIFLNVGQLLPHQLPAFHSHHYIYPIGYKIARLYWSHRVAAQRCRYICTIEEAQGRPQFVVTVEESERGYENVTYTDWTAQGVWLQILKPLQALRQESGAVRLFPQFVSGEDLFGLTEPAIVRVLESLPGVDSLTDYHFKYGRNPLLELPLAVNPTGCARSEPRIKAGAQVKKPHTQRTGSSARSAYTHSAISALDPHGPYSKQFVHSKSSQYKKMKLEWRNNVYLARSKIQGLGLYASRDLEKHTMVIEYIGEVIRAELAELREKRYEAQNRGIYMFRLDEHRVIDATISGGLARYINHSCNPNCVAEVVEVERDLRIIIFANRRIARGEELNYDYKFDIEDDQHKISCLCGAPNCKKWMN